MNSAEKDRRPGHDHRHHDQIALLGRHLHQEALAAEGQRHRSQSKHIEHVGAEDVAHGQLGVWRVQLHGGDVGGQLRQ